MSKNQQIRNTCIITPDHKASKNIHDFSVNHTHIYRQQSDNIPALSVSPDSGTMSTLSSSAAPCILLESARRAYVDLGIPEDAIDYVHHSVYPEKHTETNQSTTHCTSTTPIESPCPIAATPTHPLPKMDRGTFSAEPSTPSDKVKFPPAWPSHPAFQKSVANTTQQTARNIHGDAAWPPVRPPSSGSAAASFQGSFVEADQDEVTDLAQEAWYRPPPQQASPDDIASNLAALLAFTKPSFAALTDCNRPETPPPCPSAERAVIPISIDMKQFPDPDAWVTGCEHIHAPAPADRPRGLSNTTANKQGRLNRAHAPRRDVTQLGSDNAVSLTCNQAKVARQPAESASDGVLSSSTPTSQPLSSPRPLTSSPLVEVDARLGQSRGAYNQPATCRQPAVGSPSTSSVKVRSNAQGRVSREERDKNLDGTDDFALSSAMPSKTARAGTSPSPRSDAGNLDSHHGTPARAAACLISGPNFDAARVDTMPECVLAQTPQIEHVWTMAQESCSYAGQTRELFSLSGAQRLLGKQSDGIDFKRWTVTVGVSLGEHGMVTAQVIEGIQSTITEAINSPANGWVGHRWYVEIVRIIPEATRGISGTSTEELDGAAADETACRLLEGTEGQRHSLSEETLVQDDTDMERLLSRLLPLLACGSAHRGSTPMPGYQAHADPRVPQAFPPLALPEGHGGDKARGVAGKEKNTGPGLRSSEDRSALWTRTTPAAPPPSATIRPEGRQVGSTAAPLRTGAPRLRTDWTLRDFMPASPMPDHRLTPDPIAWRKAAVAESASKRCRQHTIQSRAAGTGQHHRQNHARPFIQPKPNPLTPTVNIEPPRQPTPRLLCAELRAPILTENYYSLLKTDVEESDEAVRPDRRRQQQRMRSGQPPPSPRTQPKHLQKPPLLPQTQPASTARGRRQPIENRPVLHQRVEGSPEIQRGSQLPHQVSLALFTRQAPHVAAGHQEQCDWCFPSRIEQAEADVLWAFAQDGPLTSRIPAWNQAAPAVWAGQRTGPARRVLPTLQYNTGCGLAARPPFSLASPAGEGGSDPRGEAGRGAAGRHRMESARPSSRRTSPTPWAGTEDMPAISPLRPGAPLPPRPPSGVTTDPGVQSGASGRDSESIQVLLRDQRDHVLLEIIRSDWDGFDHLRHGASPDLIVGLCLRKRLGGSELPRLDVLSPDAWVLPREQWPATWQELCHFASNGGSFQIRSILRGGMDPGRQAALAAINFKAGTDWNVLERLFAQVRRQEPISAEEPADYKATAELMGEASPLWQWALMEAVPGLSGRCDAGPARMTALRIILERPHARVRVVPPSVKAGSSGQLIEVRFNNVPPPRTSPSGDRASPESIKDSVLVAMETLAPQIWLDDAFVLLFTRRSIKIEGNTADLKLFSFTVVLPFGPWIASFLEERLSLWPGSYCTASSSGTFIEVALAPLDHDVFRALRLSLGLSHPTSLALLEEGLTRALSCFVACRFTTSRSASTGKGGKRSFVHCNPDEEGSSTLIMMEAAPLLMARRKELHVVVQLGVEGQYPLALKLQLPVCPQHALYRMVEPRESAPPLRMRPVRTLFMNRNVLLGPLPSGWLSNKIEMSTSEQESTRRRVARLCIDCLNAADCHFVGRREKEPNPLFLYIDFGTKAHALAFGSHHDAGTLHPAFVAFWASWFEGKELPLWSTRLLIEALEVVNSKDWKLLMELGTRSPCPSPDQGANVVR